MLSFVRLLREAAWAPVAVLILAAILARLPDARELWAPLHVFGGAALAFFFFQAIGIAGHSLGTLSPLGRHVLAFALACTLAVLWEIGEFVWDGIAGTRLQEGLADTMIDLICGVCGAGVALVLIAASGRR